MDDELQRLNERVASLEEVVLSRTGPSGAADGFADGFSDSPTARTGLTVCCALITLVIAAWVIRGVIERRSPSTFEVVFAGTTAIALALDPKGAQKISGQFLGQLAGRSLEKSE